MTDYYNQTAAMVALFRIVDRPSSGKCNFSSFPSPVTNDTTQHTDNAKQECEYKSIVHLDTVISKALVNDRNACNHTIFRHANFIGCLSADKIKMPVRKYFCFNIPVYRNMAEEPSCRSPYHEEYIQTSVSGNSEGLCRSTYSFLSERR